MAVRLLALLVIPVAVVGLSSNAWAINGGPWTWVDAATHRCLDNNAQNSVYTLPCNGGNYQNWINSQNNFGDQIKNVSTGYCLDSNANGNVYAIGCNGGNFQRWIVTWKGSGYEIKNTATLRCLDSNSSGSVYTLQCNG